jgi:uncharacterized protein (DUF924 family)
VLDQFSRNLFRERPEAFARNGMALVPAQEAVCRGADRSLPVARRAFMYMPYMHSESRCIHELALQLFSQPGMEFNLELRAEAQSYQRPLRPFSQPQCGFRPGLDY